MCVGWCVFTQPKKAIVIYLLIQRIYFRHSLHGRDSNPCFMTQSAPNTLCRGFTGQLEGGSTLQLLQIHQVISRSFPAALETFSSLPSREAGWFEPPVQPDALTEPESSFTPNKKKIETLEQDGSRWEQNSDYRLNTHTCMSGGRGCGPLHSKPANNGMGPITVV